MDVVDRDTPARLLADLGALIVEERRNLESLLAEAGIVGEREAQVAGAHDGDAQPSIQAEDLPQIPLEILDVIADATHAELAEVRQILADLGRVQMKLLGQGLRRDRTDAGVLELVEAAQVHRESVGGELGDLFEALPGMNLVRQFHKQRRL